MSVVVAQHARRVVVTVEIRLRAEEDDDSEYYANDKENATSSKAGGEKVIRKVE